MSHSKVANMTHVGKDVPKETAVPLLLARIMTRTKLTASGCWEWQGHKNAVGYGEATLGGKRYMVHRFVYQALVNEPIAAGFEICHSCHNKACLNPYHIRKDTHQANLMDSSRARKLNGQSKTHCMRGHPLSGENLSPGIWRQCRICSRARYRRRLGWPEHLAYSELVIPHGYRMDRVSGKIVAATGTMRNPP